MNRIKLFVIFLIVMTISQDIYSQNSEKNKINWMSFEEAVKKNETNPKKIFIDVYTDWCGWCKRMDQTTFIDSAVVAYMNENFYAVKFDAEQSESVEFMGYTFINENPNGPKKSPHQLAQALLQGKMSYPSYVFMDEKNELLTVVPGYVDAKSFMPILKYFGSNAYLDTKWEDYSKQAQ